MAPLARFLGVPVAALYRWLEGESEPPAAVFLKAIDLVMPAWSTEDEALARERMSSRSPPSSTDS